MILGGFLTSWHGLFWLCQDHANLEGWVALSHGCAED
jgi:hypothetical protein